MRFELREIVAIQQPVELSARHLRDPVFRLRRPIDAVLLESLVPENEAVALPVQHLHFVALPIAENEKVGGEGIERENSLDQRAQAIDRLAHVHPALADIDAHPFLGSHHDSDAKVASRFRSSSHPPLTSRVTPLANRIRSSVRGSGVSRSRTGLNATLGGPTGRAGFDCDAGTSPAKAPKARRREVHE